MSLARRSFQHYYSRLRDVALQGLPNREFGFVFFDRAGMVRHKRFPSFESLKAFLCANVPLHVYYSAALYESPSAEMRDKGLIGADLIFDIDADHLETPCNKEHDSWRCSSCGEVGRGKAPEACPRCGGGRISSQTWICEQCLQTARDHVIRLVDILKDFGLRGNDVAVFFSGHRGYHVHATSDEVRGLGSDERRELVDYVSASGMNLQYRGFPDAVPEPPSGWNLRIVQSVKAIIESSSVEELVAIGLQRRVAEAVFANRQQLAAAIAPGRAWPTVRGVGAESWRRLVAHAVSQRAAVVDSVVTVDLHRLIRMPWSLHGKTGLMVAKVEDLHAFDPLTDAVAFREGIVKVRVLSSQRIRFLGSQYSLRAGEDATLPTGLALLLVLKGYASEVGEP